MKNRIIFLVGLSLAAAFALSAQSGAATSVVGKQNVSEQTDTLRKGATQYSLDSLKYQAEFRLKTELEKLRTERYKDSMVYARMNASQLYELQMFRTDRRWTPPFRRFMDHDFFPLLAVICLLLAFWMVLRARDKGKQRAHEQKMAQFEALQKARIVWRERSLQTRENPREAGRVDEEENADFPFDGASNGGDLFEQTRRSVANYARSARRYRKTGIVLLIFSVGVMLFFAIVGSGRAWALSIIPLFIAFAYLYLDYASQKSEQRRRDYEEFKRNKTESFSSSLQKRQQTPSPKQPSADDDTTAGL